MKLNTERFLRFNLYTIIAVYLLVLVGGIVRSMGAGMGCPDWPKCFGSYIPPASVADLPEGYEEIYMEKRLIKNNRLAGVLNAIGLDGLANKVLSDPNAQKPTYFDTGKAWVEYINRLVGVVIGLFVILNMLFASAHENLWVKVLGVSSFILVLFQGWIGSLVVSTNLIPGFISFHMALALLLVALLLVQRFVSNSSDVVIKGGKLSAAILVLFTIQIIFGTQVREQVDTLKMIGVTKANWLDEMGILFYVHRSYSLILSFLIGVFVFKNKTLAIRNWLFIVLIATVVLEILLGVIMTYFAFPSFAQPLHLFVGTLSFGAIFYLFLLSNFKLRVA
ncbi:MAG: COX15/CtaA family protein [Cyclobacteriaceae bacterium]